LNGEKRRMPESDSIPMSSYEPRDFLSKIAILIGFRDRTYRKEAVDHLQLEKGDRIIEKSYHSLKASKRIVVVDQKLPTGPASLLVPLIRLLSRPIDYYRIVNERRIYDSLRHYFRNVTVKNLYWGFFYVAVSDKRVS
jgi:hypothetical protein